MKACPPPDGSLLPERQRVALTTMLRAMGENQFAAGKVKPLLPQMAQELGAVCTADEDFLAWTNELERWVRWYRVPAYYLTFVFQLVTRNSKSTYHFLACNLYSDAQTSLCDDLALNSLETAYNGYVANRAALGDAFQPVEQYIVEKLRYFHRYYYQWCRSFDYAECNPIADHLYAALSQSWLEQGFTDVAGFHANDEDALKHAIEVSQGDDFGYYGVLARRFLGLLYGGKSQYAESAEQYRLGLEQARQMHLDTEIGHLRRHYGAALREIGNLAEARHQFEQAYAYERLLNEHSTYWQALSARELADTLTRLAGKPVQAPGLANRPQDAAISLDDPKALEPALSAHHDGRLFFDGHVAVQCPFPVSRAAKQQMFRSFSGNAIQAAAFAQNVPAMIAEIEFSGPREATAVVAEMRAAGAVAPASVANYRRNRALFYSKLNTFGGNFDEYLANIVRANAARRAYLEATFPLTEQIMRAQMSDETAKEFLNTRVENTIFLFFHAGWRSGIALIADLSSGLAAPFPLHFGEWQLRQAHQEYADVLNAAQPGADRAPAIQNALAKLLSRYEGWLRPVIEPILRFLPGRHLKIFPRLQMNAVPFHALRLGGKRLIEYCDISYGQTMALFLQARGKAKEQPRSRLRMISGGVPAYDAIVPFLSGLYGSEFQVDQHPDWNSLSGSLSGAPARDILFACHGQYDPDRPDNSYLYISSGPPVSFSEVFADLDLRNSRSVMMGACESGLARSEVSAEYIGLPSAMLSSGVRYVIGALWQVNQLSTAVMVSRYFALLADGAAVPAALCQAQRELKDLSREGLSQWVRMHFQSARPAVESSLQKAVAGMDEQPFADPFYWAGFQVVGDI